MHSIAYCCDDGCSAWQPNLLPCALHLYVGMLAVHLPLPANPLHTPPPLLPALLESPAMLRHTHMLACCQHAKSPVFPSCLLPAMLMRIVHVSTCAFSCRCLKSMIGESMDLPTQALALGYLSLSWGFGTILGMHSSFTHHAVVLHVLVMHLSAANIS